MSDLDQLSDLLGSSDNLEALSSTLGTDTATTAEAIPHALAALLGGLGDNAADPEASTALTDALQRDHDGSVLDDLSGLLAGTGGSKAYDGAGIVSHIFGENTDTVVDSVAARGGVNKDLLSKLLPVLAPIVMGWLSKKLQGSGAGASSASVASGGIGDILGSVLGGLGASPSGSASSGGIGDILGSILGGSSGSDSSQGGDLASVLAGKIFGQRS